MALSGTFSVRFERLSTDVHQRRLRPRRGLIVVRTSPSYPHGYRRGQSDRSAKSLALFTIYGGARVPNRTKRELSTDVSAIEGLGMRKKSAKVQWLNVKGARQTESRSGKHFGGCVQPPAPRQGRLVPGRFPVGARISDNTTRGCDTEPGPTW